MSDNDYDYDIVATSDLHGKLVNLPKGKILLICGDICPCGESHHPIHQGHWVTNHFLPWAKEQAEQVVFIAGNHDFYFEKLIDNNKEEEFRQSLPLNVHYLRDSMVEINGLKIYGTPWTPTFGRWAFMKPDEMLANKFEAIPKELDILMGHGPAYCMSDSCEQEGWGDVINVGSKSLRNAILDRQINRFVYGHIHTAKHDERSIRSIGDNNHHTKYHCVSLVDENYEDVYKPFCLKITGI